LPLGWIEFYTWLPPLCYDIEVFVYKGRRVKNQSGPHPNRIAVAPVVVATIEVDVPDVVGISGVRGAEPPSGGAAVIIGDALVISSAACTRTEVRQFCTITREGRVVAG